MTDRLDYVANLLDPVNTRPSSIPDDEIRPHIIKKLDFQHSLTIVNDDLKGSPNDLLVLWCPHSFDPCFRVFVWNSTLNRFAFNRKVVPAQDLNQFDLFRCISGVLQVQSSTISTTNVNLNGTISAVDLNAPVYLTNLTYSTILKYGGISTDRVVGASLYDGLTMLSPPYAGGYLRPPPSNPILNEIPGSLSVPRYPSTPFPGRFPKNTSTISGTLTVNTEGLGVAPLDSQVFGRMKLTIVIDGRQLSLLGGTGAIAAEVTMASYSSTLAGGVITKYMDVCAVSPPTSGGYYAQNSATQTFYSEYPVNEVRVQIFKDPGASGTIVAGTYLSYELEYLDWLDDGYVDRGGVSIISGTNAGQILNFSGCLNVEAVPNPRLLQEIGGLSVVGYDMEQMQTAQILFGIPDNKYKTIFTTKEYEKQIRSDLPRLTDRSAMVLRASSWMPAIKAAYQIARPVIRPAVTTSLNMLDGYLNDNRRSSSDDVKRCSSSNDELEQLRQAFAQQQAELAALRGQVMQPPKEEQMSFTMVDLSRPAPVVAQQPSAVLQTRSTVIPGDVSFTVDAANNRRNYNHALYGDVEPYVASFNGHTTQMLGLASFPSVAGEYDKTNVVLSAICYTEEAASVQDIVTGAHINPSYKVFGDSFIDSRLVQNTPTLPPSLTELLKPGFYTVATLDKRSFTGSSFHLALAAAANGVYPTVAFTGCLDGSKLSEVFQKMESCRQLKVFLVIGQENVPAALDLSRKLNKNELMGFAFYPIGKEGNLDIDMFSMKCNAVQAMWTGDTTKAILRTANPSVVNVEKKLESERKQAKAVQSGLLEVTVSRKMGSANLYMKPDVDVRSLLREDHSMLIPYYVTPTKYCTIEDDGTLEIAANNISGDEAYFPYYTPVAAAWNAYYAGGGEVVYPGTQELYSANIVAKNWTKIAAAWIKHKADENWTVDNIDDDLMDQYDIPFLSDNNAVSKYIRTQLPVKMVVPVQSNVVNGVKKFPKLTKLAPPPKGPGKGKNKGKSAPAPSFVKKAWAPRAAPKPQAISSEFNRATLDIF